MTHLNGLSIQARSRNHSGGIPSIPQANLSLIGVVAHTHKAKMSRNGVEPEHQSIHTSKIICSWLLNELKKKMMMKEKEKDKEKKKMNLKKKMMKEKRKMRKKKRFRTSTYNLDQLRRVHHVLGLGSM